MARWLPFLGFFGIFVSLLAAIHAYLWLRLVHDPAWGAGVEGWAGGALWGLAATIPVAMVMRRAAGKSAGKVFTHVAYIWMGVMFLLLVGVGMVDLARGVVLGAGRLLASGGGFELSELGANRSVALGGLGLGLLASAWSVGQARRPKTKRLEVRLAGLPEALDGLRLVQLSDVHIGPTIGRSFIEALVRQVEALQADAVVITGDLVDGEVEDLAEHAAPLQHLASRYGTFFVTGNHEYYSGAEAWCRHLQTLGIRVLRNDHVEIGEGGESLQLAGIDDYQGAQFGQGADLERALRGCDPQRPIVLLAHQPRAIDEARQRGVALVLSGHTHGGQLWPFGAFVLLQQPVVAGLHRIGETWLYVSCGTGYWGPPMRLGAPAEVTLLTLRVG